MRSRRTRPAVDKTAPAAGRKAVIYATCFVNYDNPGIGEAAQAVLARNGVETEVIYPQCCGMPQLEAGDLSKVAGAARHVAAGLSPISSPRLPVSAPCIGLRRFIERTQAVERPLKPPGVRFFRLGLEPIRDLVEAFVARGPGHAGIHVGVFRGFAGDCCAQIVVGSPDPP